MRKIKNIADKIVAGIALIILSPIMLIACIGIKLSSKGTVLYKAKRMGKDLKPIIIYKFRTMRMDTEQEGAITAIDDDRIFPWGNILRKTKIDELPQLFNVLEGSMSIIGPRPEYIYIFKKYYTVKENTTLNVLPGLACSGSIFNYTHGDQYLKGKDIDKIYVKEFMHIKLALDLYYLEHWNLLYDVEIIIRTIYVILITSLSSRKIEFPMEYRRVFGKRDYKT